MISLAGRDIQHAWGKFVFTGVGLGLLIAGKNAINDWMGRKQRADKAHCSLPAAGARATQL